MNISQNIKNICVLFNRLLFTIVFCIVTTKVVDAKTISNNNTTGSSDYIEMFKNMYDRSNYNDYLLSIESVTSGYSTYYNYYFCLSDEVNVTNQLTASASCKEMYLYSRSNNSNYTLEKINDDSLVVSNSVYYKADTRDIKYYIKKYGSIITMILLVLFFYIVLYGVFSCIG